MKLIIKAILFFFVFGIILGPLSMVIHYSFNAITDGAGMVGSTMVEENVTSQLSTFDNVFVTVYALYLVGIILFILIYAISKYFGGGEQNYDQM